MTTGSAQHTLRALGDGTDAAAHRGGHHDLSAADHSRVIEMAWEDRTPFEAIEQLYGLSENKVITLMRASLKPRAFKNWRERVSGRKTKHALRRDPAVSRGYCSTQYKLRSK